MVILEAKMIRFASTTATSTVPRLRIAAINDVYELQHLPRMQTLLRQLQPMADVVALAGDFLSPSPLSALDGGKGMVATMRALGMTHVSLGNHEADLKLPKLRKRLKELQNITPSPSTTDFPLVLNSNIGFTTTTEDDEDKAEWEWLTKELRRYDVVTTPCGRVRVGLLGLMSDESSMFRDGTFRGAPIGDVTECFTNVYKELVVDGQQADWLLPLTHQSLDRDKELAAHMLQVQPGANAIIGGHEHEPFDIVVQDPNDNNESSSYTRILKSGTNANGVSLIDIFFDVQEDDQGQNRQVRVGEINYDLIDIRALSPSMVVQNIVDRHESLLVSMENEDVLHAEPLLPPGELLSSERTRLKQTTMGAVLCTCIKEELEVDVAILNGAVIKGNATYPSSRLKYSEIRKELPFPTKIVVVPMKRWELQAAIEYSRTNPVSEDGDPDKPIDRRGFLQVDLQYDHYGFHTGEQDAELLVALPRNLLSGFCSIIPLMEVGDRLKQADLFPEADDFVPAIDLVIRHSSKERWYELIQDKYTFSDLDADAKGYLNRDDVARILKKAIGHDPPEFLVEDMITAMDADGNEVIDPGEMSHLLAVIEREHGLF